MSDELDKPIGTKETVKLSAGSVIVKEITIEPPKEGSKAKLICLHCLHPNKEELIKLSALNTKKVQGNNITIKKETLWYNTDEDGNIKKLSAGAKLMEFYNKKTLREFVNSSITTESDANGYLVIKAY